jgi:hypothetical protein
MQKIKSFNLMEWNRSRGKEMKRELPPQLQKPEFRFFRIPKNQKSPPCDPKWNSDNCFTFYDNRIKAHLESGGNIGIATGHGSLIVIDFDDAQYQKEKAYQLPPTFIVRTALKGLQHHYYILEGKMFKKIGIDMGEKRVCDIQAARAAVVCPPSTINTKCYSVVNDAEIAEIDCAALSKILNVNYFKEPRHREYDIEILPKKIDKTIRMLKELGVKRTNLRHFKCPFHTMHGNGNLYIMNDAALYCFHCQRYFPDALSFKEALHPDITVLI